MRLGIIKVTPHLLEDDSWSQIYKKLTLNFREIERKFDAFHGYWMLAGESPLFDDLKEGEQPPVYVAHFISAKGDLVVFEKFSRE